MLKALIKQLLKRNASPARGPVHSTFPARSACAPDLVEWCELDANALASREEALVELCACLARQDRVEEALQLLRRASTAERPSLPLLRGLVNLVEETGDLDAAEEEVRRALASFPEDPRLLLAHANVLADLGRWEAARERYDEALAMLPGFVAAHFNRALLSMGTLNLAEAIAGFERVIALQPEFINAHLNIALVHLASGELERGWKEYAIRFHPGLGNLAAKARALHLPEWQGQELRGKRILVSGEQGIGDQILFASMYPDLVARAEACVFECTSKLVPLFAHSFPCSTVVAICDPPDARASEGLDWRVSAGSVARWLRPDLASFPTSRLGYLGAVPQRVEHWRRRLSGLEARLKVGICWRSSNTKGDRALACTDLTQWSGVFAVEGVCFVNLQYDECSVELARAERQTGVGVWRAPGVDLFDDLLETSALMQSLDLVISAPTVVSLHAAALGVPTWQLTCGLEWQTLGTDRNPWLPALTRYFRRADQSWDEILDAIAVDLGRTVDAHSAS